MVVGRGMGGRELLQRIIAAKLNSAGSRGRNGRCEFSAKLRRTIGPERQPKAPRSRGKVVLLTLHAKAFTPVHRDLRPRVLPRGGTFRLLPDANPFRQRAADPIIWHADAYAMRRQGQAPAQISASMAMIGG